MDDATRADMEQWTGCVAGALTRAEYESALAEAGLVDVDIRETHRVHEHAASAIVRARRPQPARRVTTQPATLRGAQGDAVAIRDATSADAGAIAALYNQGIAERQATFETRPRSPAEIAGWLEPDLPFIVAEMDGRVVGFARVSPYSDRCVYEGVGEHGVYVDAAARGHGVGRSLLDALARAAEAHGHLQAHQPHLHDQRRQPRRAPRGGIRGGRRAAPPRPPGRRVEGLRARGAAAG